MLARFGKFLVVVALVTTTGLHWAVLQSVAWTTMLADNLRTQSLTEAVTHTFDGNHPCCLCKAIAAGRKSEQKKEFTAPLQKLEFHAGQRKLCFDCPVEFSTIAAGKLFRRFSHPKAADAPTARVLRLIQSQLGCSRRVGAGKNYFHLTLRAPLRVLAILKFEYEK